jgi:hypothetical protein
MCVALDCACLNRQERVDELHLLQFVISNLLHRIWLVEIEERPVQTAKKSCAYGYARTGLLSQVNFLEWYTSAAKYSLGSLVLIEN